MKRDTSLPDPTQHAFDQAVETLSSRRLTFTEQEAFQQIWDNGLEIAPTMDARFVPVNGAGAKNPQHWRLVSQTLVNDRLLQALAMEEWDGYDLEAALNRFDTEDSSHYILYPLDPRFRREQDGRWQLTEPERTFTIEPDTLLALNAVLPHLLSHWHTLGALPQTSRQVAAILADIGWSHSDSVLAWLSVRAWLGLQPEMARVGQDQWLPAELLPIPQPEPRLRVAPVYGVAPASVPVDSPLDSVQVTPSDTDEAEDDVPPAAIDANRASVTWTIPLRTSHVSAGFLPIPIGAQTMLPTHDHAGFVTLQGKWFDDDTDLHVWLSIDQHRLFGADLADKLSWCDTGTRLHITWTWDRIIFRTDGINETVNREESRLIDLETLSTSRGGIGESYRQSLVAILQAAPEGLTFPELIKSLSERQQHEIHRGTIRALLSACGFVQRGGKWFLGEAQEIGARKIRQALLNSIASEADMISNVAHVEPNVSLAATLDTIKRRLKQLIQTDTTS